MNPRLATPASTRTPFRLIRLPTTRPPAVRADAVRVPTAELIFSPQDLAPYQDIEHDNHLQDSTEGNDLVLTLSIIDEEMVVGDEVSLIVDGVLRPETTTTVFATDSVSLVLPASLHAKAGTFSINYRLQYISGGSNDIDGPEGNSFTVDYDEPGLPDLAPPEFAFNPVSGLTPENLDKNGDLTAHVFSYKGMAAYDIIHGTIDEKPVVISRVPTSTRAGDSITVTYPSSVLAGLDDGEHGFGYYVTDRAGNRSPNSATTTIVTVLKGYISDLAAPYVPAMEDGMVDDADARTNAGLTKLIVPSHDRLDESYSVIAHWGSFRSAPEHILPGSPDPALTVGIPYAPVYATWFASSKGEDRSETTNVRYDVYRNGLFAGRSPSTKVNVNLAVAGGEDPSPETPVHESLDPPTLISADGSVNVIPFEDFKKDAVISVPFFTNDADPKPVFTLADFVTVYYEGNELTYSITQGDMIDKVPVRVQVPGAIIGEVGVGAQNVRYTVRRNLKEGGSNTSSAPTRVVMVNGPGDLPGDGNQLAAPDWKDSERPTTPGLRDIIDVARARVGVTIEIPKYANKKVGDLITVSLHQFSNWDHNDGEPSLSPPRNGVHSVVVQAGGEEELSSVQFPYNELIYPNVRPGMTHGHFVYSVLGAGQSEQVKSAPLLLRIDARGAPGK